MGILECASGASVWRGYDYYKEKKVSRILREGENLFFAVVEGSSNNFYSVELHVDHPRRSKCNCPHADGKKIICKHIIATYFTAFPSVAEELYTEAMAYQEEEEKREEEIYEKVCQYVWQMKKREAQEALLRLLLDDPDWQYDRFVRENIDNEW